MAKTLKIHFPFKPFKVTQRWGNPNTAYQGPFGFGHHNGIDANTGRLDWKNKPFTDYPVYCPVEGFTVQLVRYVPNGGGNEMWLISDTPVQIGEEECYAYIPLCHAKKILVKPGDHPKVGELLMIADNTGFSTGLHTHMGLYRVGWDGIRVTKYLDTNDMNGSYDPSEFLTGQYANDLATLPTLILNGLRYYSWVVGG